MSCFICASRVSNFHSQDWLGDCRTEHEVVCWQHVFRVKRRFIQLCLWSATSFHVAGCARGCNRVRTSPADAPFREAHPCASGLAWHRMKLSHRVLQNVFAQRIFCQAIRGGRGKVWGRLAKPPGTHLSTTHAEHNHDFLKNIRMDSACRLQHWLHGSLEGHGVLEVLLRVSTALSFQVHVSVPDADY